MEEIVTRSYKAFDGKIFSNKAKCEEYEKQYIFNKENYALYDLDGKEIEGYDYDNVDFDIIEIKNQKASDYFDCFFDLGLHDVEPGIYCYDYNREEGWLPLKIFLEYNKKLFKIYETCKKIYTSYLGVE